MNLCQSPCKFPAQGYVSLLLAFFSCKLRPARCLAHLLLPVHAGVLYWWGFQDAELACVLSHLFHKRKLPQLLTQMLRCVLALGEPVPALYTVFWMTQEHPNMACLVLGRIIDAGFLKVFFDHCCLFLFSLLPLSTLKVKAAFNHFQLVFCQLHLTWWFGQQWLCCCPCSRSGCTLHQELLVCMWRARSPESSVSLMSEMKTLCWC